MNKKYRKFLQFCFSFLQLVGVSGALDEKKEEPGAEFLVTSEQCFSQYVELTSQNVVIISLSVDHAC